MRKRVAVYVPIGDGTRDRGEKTYDLYFDDDEITMQTGFKVLETIPLSAVKSIDCYRAANPRGSDAASGAVTGLLLGGVGGAIVGGLVGSANKGSWYIEIVTEEKTMTYRIVLENHKMVFDKWAKKHGW